MKIDAKYKLNVKRNENEREMESVRGGKEMKGIKSRKFEARNRLSLWFVDDLYMVGDVNVNEWVSKPLKCSLSASLICHFSSHLIPRNHLLILVRRRNSFSSLSLFSTIIKIYAKPLEPPCLICTHNVEN